MITLALHVAIGCATLVYGMFAIAKSRAVRADELAEMSKTLAFIAALDILSGSVLALLSADIMAVSLCKNVALYLMLVLFVEFHLLRRAGVGFSAPSITGVMSPMAASLVPLVLLIVQGQ